MCVYYKHICRCMPQCLWPSWQTNWRDIWIRYRDIWENTVWGLDLAQKFLQDRPVTPAKSWSPSEILASAPPPPLHWHNNHSRSPLLSVGASAALCTDVGEKKVSQKDWHRSLVKKKISKKKKKEESIGPCDLVIGSTHHQAPSPINCDDPKSFKLHVQNGMVAQKVASPNESPAKIFLNVFLGGWGCF